MWEDKLILAAQIVLFFALLPTIFEKRHKPAKSTSFITASALAAMSLALYSLSAYAGALMTFVNAIAWLVIFYQRLVLDRLEQKFNLNNN